MSVDVSVVIPTRDRREFLEQAIASCFEDNDGVSIEVVVVDDGSTDGTRAWLEALDDRRVRAVFPGHQGPQGARNHGLRAATGRYVKFLDDDDWLAPGTLRREVHALADAGAELVAGDALVWKDGAVIQRLTAPREPDPFLDLASSDATAHPFKYTMARSLAESTLWDTRVLIRTDLEFMLRASRVASGYARIDGAAGYFRIHGGLRLSTPRHSYEGSSTHLRLLISTAEVLLEEGATPERAAAVQLGLWRWLHLLYPADRQETLRAWDLIQALDSGTPFTPPRPSAILRLMDRLVGPLNVEEMTRVPRRIKLWLAP